MKQTFEATVLIEIDIDPSKEEIVTLAEAKEALEIQTGFEVIRIVERVTE